MEIALGENGEISVEEADQFPRSVKCARKIVVRREGKTGTRTDPVVKGGMVFHNVLVGKFGGNGSSEREGNREQGSEGFEGSRNSDESDFQ